MCKDNLRFHCSRQFHSGKFCFLAREPTYIYKVVYKLSFVRFCSQSPLSLISQQTCSWQLFGSYHSAPGGPGHCREEGEPLESPQRGGGASCLRHCTDHFILLPPPSPHIPVPLPLFSLLAPPLVLLQNFSIFLQPVVLQ